MRDGVCERFELLVRGLQFPAPALEARIGEIANSIRDEVVRRYYRQDLVERLARTFAPEAPRAFPNRGSFSRESGRKFPPRGPAGRPPFARGQGMAGTQPLAGGPYQAASPQLANSPIMRGQRSAMSRREDIVSCIDVTIMDRSAHSALPSPYSKIFPATEPENALDLSSKSRTVWRLGLITT